MAYGSVHLTRPASVGVRSHSDDSGNVFVHLESGEVSAVVSGRPEDVAELLYRAARQAIREAHSALVPAPVVNVEPVPGASTPELVLRALVGDR